MMHNPLTAASLLFCLLFGAPVGESRVDSSTGPVETQDEEAWFGAALAGTRTSVGASAVLLESVVEGGPAWDAGLRTGNYIFELDGQSIGATGEKALANMLAKLAARKPGDPLKLAVLQRFVNWRDDDGRVVSPPNTLVVERELRLGATKSFSVTALALPMEMVVILGRQPQEPTTTFPATSKLYEHVERSPFPLQDEIESAIQEAGLDADNQDLRARLGKLAVEGDRSRLSIVPLAHREPFALPGIADYMGDRLAVLADTEPAKLMSKLHGEISSIADWGALKPLVHGGEAPGPEASLADHLAWLESRLALAASCVGAGLADLTDDDRTHVADHWADLTDRFEGDIYLYTDPNRGRADRNLRTVAIGEQVKPAEILRGAGAFAQCANPAYVAALAKAAAAANLDLGAETVVTHQTPFGLIVIGGTSDDNHRRGVHGEDTSSKDMVALWIDLGGNDYYGGSAGTTVNQAGRPVIPVGVVIDVEGNDSYEAAQDGSIGAGVLGLGMIVDLAGDDSYIGRRWSQGVGFMGVGLVLDGAGDDRYRGKSLTQGVGAWGVGAVFDQHGDDSYDARRFGQGVGLAGGVGLVGDAWGDDEYYCKGEWPTTYGTAGVFEGWGQGCGVGFRTNASGGIGMLGDNSGHDRYEAGNFSQGGGYYFGFGALFDRGPEGDDYIGSRYNQGFSAHQAVGYFHEFGGDDTYLTRNAVAPGLAWDECVTFFRDDAGDDLYQGGSFSLAASAHNSVSVFWDLGGEDEYRWADLAHAGGNDYHGGTSLSYFLDSGGDVDSYSGTQENNSTKSAAEHSFFVDR